MVGALWVALGIPGMAESANWDPRIPAAVLRGNDHLLNQDLPQAEEAFRSIEAIPGGALVSKFFRPFVVMARAMEREDADDYAADLDLFIRQIGDVIQEVDRAVEADPRDPDLHLLYGLATGFRAMAEATRKHYLGAVADVYRAHRSLTESLRLDPGKADAYYVLGLIDYGLARLPALLRTLSRLVLPAGDRQRGLEEIRVAAERGTYTRMWARMALGQLYTYQEADYARGLPYIEELHARYPGNPELYFLLAFVHSESGRFEQALEVARRIKDHIDGEGNHFTRAMLPRYLQLMGKIYMDHRDYATALAFFRQTIAKANRRYNWTTAWAWTRTGMIHDLLGERAEATRSYQMALRVEAEGGVAKTLARRFLNEPYTGGNPRQYLQN